MATTRHHPLLVFLVHMTQSILLRQIAYLKAENAILRSRVTQIMNLLNLTPEIQEKLLFLRGTASGRDSISEREMRRVCERMFWKEQRQKL